MYPDRIIDTKNVFKYNYLICNYFSCLPIARCLGIENRLSCWLPQHTLVELNGLKYCIFDNDSNIQRIKCRLPDLDLIEISGKKAEMLLNIKVPSEEQLGELFALYPTNVDYEVKEQLYKLLYTLSENKVMYNVTFNSLHPKQKPIVK